MYMDNKKGRRKMKEPIEEIWRDVVGFEGIYQVSNTGIVRRIYPNKTKILKQCKAGGRTNKEYLYVNMSANGKYRSSSVHRLVAEAFIPNPEGLPQVNHIDEDKFNNCVGNLEWCDASYNNRYGTKISRGVNTMKKSRRIDKKLEKIMTSGKTAGEMLTELKELMPQFEYEEVDA